MARPLKDAGTVARVHRRDPRVFSGPTRFPVSSFRPGPTLFMVVLCFLILAAAGKGAAARELPARLGAPTAGVPGQPADEAGAGPSVFVSDEGPPPETTPRQQFAAEQVGPLAADGAGRLLLLVPTIDGYGVYGSVGPVSEANFELIYRRKGVHGTSLAVGPGGLFCVGVATGVDCVDGAGAVVHLEHPLLTNIVGLTVDGERRLWVLRSARGGTTALQLVRLDLAAGPRSEPAFGLASDPTSYFSPEASSGAEPVVVLSFREAVTAFPGNGLSAAPGGGVFVPVVENDMHRLIHVDDGGRLRRRGDFWRLEGGVVADRHGTVLLTGVNRPRSVKEQQNPVDVVLWAGPGDGSGAGREGTSASAVGSAFDSGVAARFPSAPSGLGSRPSGYAALGGDGVLYTFREEPVMGPEGPRLNGSVLWAVDWGRPGLLGGADRVIDFRIPYVADVAGASLLLDPSFVARDYAGPLLIGRGQLLVVAGVNFTGKEGARRVLFGNLSGAAEAWDDDLILVRVPDDAAPGPTEVRVAVDSVLSDVVSIEVKTADVPGWFQIGSPAMEALLRGSFTIRGYSGTVSIAGITLAGEIVAREESMVTPGLFHVRLPDGAYEATFRGAYLVSEVHYGPDNQYLGSSHVPVMVPEQTFVFEISDESPVAMWMPVMLGE